MEDAYKTNGNSPPTFKKIAATMLERGIPVIPIPPGEKRAILKAWPELATTDPQQIENWNNQNPQSNCGAVAKFEGFWFLDCDDPELPERIERERPARNYRAP